MSTAIKLVKKFIDSAAGKYPGSSFKYEFIENSETHIIEVLPSELALKDKAFAEDQFNFVNTFLEKFPYESICFVTDGDLIKVANPIHQSGQFETFNMVGMLDILLQEFDIKISKKTKMSIYFESPLKSSEIFNQNLIQDVRIIVNEFKKESTILDSKVSEPIVDFETLKTNAGESNYAMAA